jgi:hypothetical protein
MNVTAVEPKGDKAALLIMENGVKVWTPDIEKAKALVGKPIPGDWTQREGDYGPQALPPKDKKGAPATAFRNTKEGQAFEQQQMNRRTALMQAVLSGSTGSGDILVRSDIFYDWLQSSPVLGRAAAAPAVPSAGDTSAGGVDLEAPDHVGEGEVGSGSEGSAPSALTDCIHPKRTTTASGKVRCVVCSQILEGAA